MAVQLIVRGLLALRRHRAAAAEAKRAELEAASEARGEKATPTPKQEGGKSKPAFAIDGRTIKQATFDPDDPDSATPYPEDEADAGRDRMCTMCLGPRRDTTATECGHVCEWWSLNWASSLGGAGAPAGYCNVVARLADNCCFTSSQSAGSASWGGQGTR